MIQVTSLNVHTNVCTVQTKLDIEHTSVGLTHTRPISPFLIAHGIVNDESILDMHKH